MYINYIILAHKNPDQLERLVSRLDGIWSKFFIHIDKKVSLEPFLKSIGEKHNVYFLNESERKLGTWGDFDIVQGTLNAMRKISAEKSSGYCVLMSGQDYPLKGNSEIHNFFQNQFPTNFISIYQFPGNWSNHFKPRIDRYKINKSLKRGHFLFLPSIYDKDFYQFKTLCKLNFLRKSGRIKEWKNILRKRNFPKILKPYGGGVYWALPVETVELILDFISKNPKYIEYHKYTLCADEIFFHSIIMHLHDSLQIPLKESLTYVNWSRKSGPLPVTFKIEDFGELKEVSEKYLFARKFDEKLDKKVLNKCDEVLLS